MARDGSETRDKILDVAEIMALEMGFAACAIEQIAETASLTKGAFFYHFKTKAELAQTLLGRAIAREAEMLEALLARAERLGRKAADCYLVFIGLLIEEVEQAPPAGSLIATLMHEAGALDDETHRGLKAAFAPWHDTLSPLVAEALAGTRGEETRPEIMIDNLIVSYTGGLMLARLHEDPSKLIQQLAAHRRYAETVFED